MELEQSRKTISIESFRPKDHLALPYPSSEYDFLAINIPSSYQQGLIPDGEEPPWGMLRVVATARERFNFNAGILDAHRLRLSAEAIREQILKTKTKLVGLNPTSVNLPEAKIVANICNEIQVPYIIGGVEATLNPQVARQDFPEAFAVVRGHGELAIGEVLDSFYNGGEKSKNAGIYYLNQDVNSTSNYAPKLKPEEVPLVRQDIYIESPLYKNTISINGHPQEIHEATLFVTDGCPFECTFCASPVMVNRGKDVSYMNPGTARIVEEVAQVVRLGADAIHFLDDILFMSGSDVVNFYEGLAEKKLLGNFIWRGMMRAPTILKPDFTDEVINMMKDSGVWKIALGIESGSDDVLKRIKKHINTEQVVDAVAKLSSYGIQAKGFFIFGFPGETEKEMIATLEFINRLKGVGLTEISAFQFKPYPGTQEFINLMKEKPDILSQLSYLRRTHETLNGKAQGKADNHFWLPDDLQIADVPSGVVREYVEKSLEFFYNC